MIFFILLIVSSITLSAGRNVVTFCFWVGITLVSAFRYETGTDYINYVQMYYDINRGFESYLQMEPFHIILNKLSFGYQFVFFIYSTLTLSTFCFMYYRFSQLTSFCISSKDRVWVFIIVTVIFFGNFYFLSLNSIRSSLAIALYCLGIFYFIEGRKRALCYILFVCSGLVHFSSIPVSLVTLLVLSYLFPVRNFLFLFILFISTMNPIGFIKGFYVANQFPYYNYFISDLYAVPVSSIGYLTTFMTALLLLIFYFIAIREKEFRESSVKGLLQFSILSYVFFRFAGNDFFIFVRMAKFLSPIIYFLVSFWIVCFINTRLTFVNKYALRFLLLIVIIFSNLVMFFPRGISDPSYGNYKINYCIFYEDKCDYVVSEF